MPIIATEPGLGVSENRFARYTQPCPAMLAHSNPSLVADVADTEALVNTTTNPLESTEPPSLEVQERALLVRLGRRAHHPLLIAAGYGEDSVPLPWLGGRQLRLTFG